jgi:hypothetical protein
MGFSPIREGKGNEEVNVLYTSCLAALISYPKEIG